jgi:hypothetical protein
VARVRPIFWSQRRFILLCALFAVGNAALVVTEPYLYGRIIDALTAALAGHRGAAEGIALIARFWAHGPRSCSARRP